jgi:hypothetical protein
MGHHRASTDVHGGSTSACRLAPSHDFTADGLASIGRQPASPTVLACTAARVVTDVTVVFMGVLPRSLKSASGNHGDDKLLRGIRSEDECSRADP